MEKNGQHNTKENVPKEFSNRFEARREELSELYLSLYPGQEDFFSELCSEMLQYYKDRPASLRKLDAQREQDANWYKRNDLLGMMMYTDAFAKDLKGVREHLDYIESCNVNYLHLMPLLESPEGKSDGGYAVSDYRKVQEKLGTMKDLRQLTEDCHKRNICVCLDYVMNHTSEEHEWAKRARSGEKEYQDRYFFYDSYEIPEQFEKTVPQVFPRTAPGNFTYLSELNKFVMTTFHPYQWDLNYWNPVVMNEMILQMLFLVNQGIDVIRIDAVPYIWKRLGTNCRNLPEVHTIVRIMRLISEIVCPGVLLLGEVVMEPKELAPYFGTPEKPECHLLYNATTMATLWHTVATKDVRLLRYQTDQVNALPKEYSFLNYLRCHDDIGWGLDYKFLKGFGMEEVAHKQFLNDYFLGKHPESTSTGELYNYDPVTRDARFCGTTASMCGIERGEFEGDAIKQEAGVQLDLMLHAFLLFQSGIPVIYSGDEVARCNDWSYKNDPLKEEDSRYVHRGSFDWSVVPDIGKKCSPSCKIFTGLKEIEEKRSSDTIFDGSASVYTIGTYNDSVLGMVRIREEEWMIGLFNFSDRTQQIWVSELKDRFRNVFNGRYTDGETVFMPPYSYMWLKKE
jgi:amylosucrase